MNNSTHVMIDLETLGLKPGCQIISIGASVLYAHKQQGKDTKFYVTIKRDSRFSTNPATLAWWSKQPISLTYESLENKTQMEDALLKFSEFLKQFDNPKVWGNAASFDLKILEAAYEICGITVPWNFRNELCYRTLKALYPQIPYVKPTCSHHALSDAMAQALQLEQILNHMERCNGTSSILP